jgi:hypothetical protein
MELYPVNRSAQFTLQLPPPDPPSGKKQKFSKRLKKWMKNPVKSTPPRSTITVAELRTPDSRVSLSITKFESGETLNQTFVEIGGYSAADVRDSFDTNWVAFWRQRLSLSKKATREGTAYYQDPKSRARPIALAEQSSLAQIQDASQYYSNSRARAKVSPLTQQRQVAQTNVLPYYSDPRTTSLPVTPLPPAQFQEVQANLLTYYPDLRAGSRVVNMVEQLPEPQIDALPLYSDSRTRPRVVTLAEQLREAQADTLQFYSTSNVSASLQRG